MLLPVPKYYGHLRCALEISRKKMGANIIVDLDM